MRTQRTQSNSSWRSFVLVCGLAWVCLAGTLSCGAAVEWVSRDGFRFAQLPGTTSARPENTPGTLRSPTAGFFLMPSTSTGIRFTNSMALARHLTNQIYLNGSGVAAGDVDGDGWCDLYFCGLDTPNALYRNLGGWRFEEIASRAGVACEKMICTGAALADLDGDRDLDLVVNSVGGGTQIFRNDGKGKFSPWHTANQGRGGMSIALADVNGDGFLDIYITNYRTSALMDIPNARAWFKVVNGKTVVEKLNNRPTTEPDLTNRFMVNARGAVVELGEPDLLLRNDQGRGFTPVPFDQGNFLGEDGQPLKALLFDWGLSAMFRDLNRDGAPDLYVCNDFDSEDRLWLNLGDGRFQMAPRLSLRKTSWFSMGADFADINRDGHDDLVVLDMLSREHRQRMVQLGDPGSTVSNGAEILDRPQSGLNTLFLSRGDGTFAEVAQLAGLEATEWSWAAVFLDVDLDGWEDLLITNGQERAARDADVADQLRQMRAARPLSDSEIFQARTMFPRLSTPNLAYRNQRDLTFAEMGETWGFNHAGVSHGMALADLDNDGDLDVVINNFNDAPLIYRTESTAPRVAVRLRGMGANSGGIGARIEVRSSGLPVQVQEMIAGGRYLSSDEPLRVFAVAETGTTIDVYWRSGRRSSVADVQPNQLYEISEPEQLTQHNTARTAAQRGRPALFEDVSDRLQHQHADQLFDDFARQPLLPYRLSQLGPGIAWHDIDQDGWDDLVIGAGKGGQCAVYRNDTGNKFTRLTGPPFAQPVARDQTGLLCWFNGTNTVLLAGSANYEDGMAVGGAVRQFQVQNRVVADLIPGNSSSTGPLAMADIDGDEDLDLFVGGRVIPGRYPEAATSRLFRYQAGRFQADPENNRLLEKVGLVSSGLFTDLDGDGDSDLVLACEWGPIRIFRNDSGRLADATQAWGMDRYLGWWNGVAAGDFNADGRLDLVAANWGRNTKYQRYRQEPLSVWFGDFDGAAGVDLLEAHFEPGLQKWVPNRQLDMVARAIPGLREKFPLNRDYAGAAVQDLLGSAASRAREWKANWLETTVFLNRGDQFEPRILPPEAQMAPAFGVAVADFNMDGHEDIFLSQNLFAVDAETPRYDAGRGLLLAGEGTGGFVALTGQESGFLIYGEQRGCAVADFDGDGRPDLAVAQNSAATKLFRNSSAPAGLRIRLKGPVGNPHGIGASVRLGSSGVYGPSREVSSGSGYWSQNSPVLIFARPAAPAEVLVRWPDGKLSTYAVPPNAKEVEVQQSGESRVLR